MRLAVYQTVSLHFGPLGGAEDPYRLQGIWTAGMLVKRFAPLGAGAPSMQHNGEGFYTPIRFDN